MFFIIELILFWIIVYAILTGFGLSIIQLFGLHIQTELDLFLTFWLGFAGIIGTLQIWNLFFPVNHIIRIIIICWAIFALLLNAKKLWLIYRRIPWYLYLLFLIGIFFTAKDAFAHSAGSGFDTGLYHLQMLRWIEFSAVVPGLGNLHGRLAFSNMFALYGSFLSVGQWAMSIHITAYGILHIVTFATLTSIIWRDKNNFARFISLLIFATVVFSLFRRPHGLLTDPIIFLLQAIVVCLIIFFIGEKTLSDNQKKLYILSLSVLITLAALIKLSSIVFSLIIFIGLWLLMMKRHPILTRRMIIGVFLLLTLLSVPFLIRNVIVSGYLLYPVVQTGIEFDWTIEPVQVISEANWVRSWARQPNTPREEVLGNWNWLRAWYALHIQSGSFNLTLLLVASSTILIAARYKQIRQHITSGKFESAYFLVLLALIFSLIYWFFTAPDPRFAGITIQAFSFFMLYLALMTFSKTIQWIVLILVIGYVLITARPPFSLFYPTFPQERQILWMTEIDVFTTENGGIVNYPVDPAGQCWDAPLPCTISPRSFLEFRDLDDMKQGFTIHLPNN
ncbi:MAG: hypothetical protein WBC91_11205 [Phototrophicaceae bacterium]